MGIFEDDDADAALLQIEELERKNAELTQANEQLKSKLAETQATPVRAAAAAPKVSTPNDAVPAEPVDAWKVFDDAISRGAPPDQAQAEWVAAKRRAQMGNG